jgi:hypothetical protein
MKRLCGSWEVGGARLIKVPRLEVKDGVVGIHAMALR